MNMKTFVWGGTFIGSTIGGFLPLLWGDNGLSLGSLVWSSVGAFVGILVGYYVGKQLGA